MDEKFLILLLIIVFIIVWAMLKMGMVQGYSGGSSRRMDEFVGGTDGCSDQMVGGKDADGFAYIADEKVDDLNIKGSAVVKGTTIAKDLNSNGNLNIRDSSVGKKATIVGNIEAKNCQFDDVQIQGTGNLFKSKAGKVHVCGKLKAKATDIDEIVIDSKCEMSEASMPYVKLHGGVIKKITYPKGMSDDMKAKVVLQK